MPIVRNEIIRGPALVIHNGASMYTEGDVTVAVNGPQFDVALWGQRIDRRLEDFTATIQFTPVGVFSAPMVTALLPWLSAMPGTSMMGAMDKSTVVHGVDGRKLTFLSSAVTGMPDVNFAANAQLWKQATITAVRGTGLATSAANSLWTETVEAFPNVSLDLATIPTLPYMVSYLETPPWDNIALADGGLTVSFDLQTEEDKADEVGTYDVIFQAVAATATFTPLHGTLAQLLQTLALSQGAGAVRGASLRPRGGTLVIDGGVGNPICTIPNALPAEVLNLNWGATTRRPGEVALQAVRSFTAGAFTPLLTLATHTAEG